MENHEAAEPNRVFQYDNLRFLLILLVVAGHAIKLLPAGKITAVYRIIYSFHMPAFLFLTGRFARFEKKRIFRFFILYMVFQTLYLCFSAFVLKESDLLIQYTTPYWILWYLLAITIYYLLIPMLPSDDPHQCCLLLFGSVILSLLIGYDTSVGDYLSLSRVIVFAPFFLLGYYEHTIHTFITDWLQRNKIKIPVVGLCLLLISVGELYILYMPVSISLLYGSCSYASCKSTAADRLILIITAAAWIELFRIIIPKKRLPVITGFGQRTLPVYLFHGFIIRLLEKHHVFHYSTAGNLLLVCFVTAFIILAFGNRYIKSLLIT